MPVATPGKRRKRGQAETDTGKAKNSDRKAELAAKQEIDAGPAPAAGTAAPPLSVQEQSSKKRKRATAVKSEAPGTPVGSSRDQAIMSMMVRTRSSVADGRPIFATTGCEISERQKRILAELGAVFVADWSPHITHLVADTFRRTAKMMCAICRGARVVLPEYVAACRSAGKFVDDKDFVLRDSVCEAAFARKRGISQGYSLVEALTRARTNGPLLKGISVYCFPSVVEKRELPLLVSSAGGTWLNRFPAQPDDESVLLLAERAVGSEKEQQRRRLHAVYDVELIREAACTQEIRRSAYRLR